MIRMELPGKGKRGRPKRSCIDAMREDMAAVEVTEVWRMQKFKWRWENRLCRPLTGEAERKTIRGAQLHTD